MEVSTIPKVIVAHRQMRDGYQSLYMTYLLADC